MALIKTDLPLPLVASGKVRSIYALPSDDTKLLFVATDRISSFDVVLANGIPQKGRLLTLMSAFWFALLSQKLPHVPTHFLTMDLPPEIASSPTQARPYRNRAMQVRRLEVLPIESIVRGYITGSAWAEFMYSGTVHGIPLPVRLRESEALPTPLWTPSTKAEAGEKDENISPSQAKALVGADVAYQVEQLSLEVYRVAAAHAESKGVIIADTKFEFALDRTREPPVVVLVDEVLTPDSSRFWLRQDYEVGRPQRSLDKQYLRDWLIKEGLKGKEGVEMPPNVVEGTRKAYVDAFERLTGQKWEDHDEGGSSPQ